MLSILLISTATGVGIVKETDTKGVAQQLAVAPHASTKKATDP